MAKDKKVNPLQGRFTLIATAIKNVMKSQATYETEMKYLAELAAEGKSPSELAYGKKKAEDKLAAAKESSVETLRAYLADLKQTITERNQLLDLSNPALTNALQLVSTIGDKLDNTTINQINANFANDQAALQAIRQLYRAYGVNSSSLDEMTYDVKQTFDELEFQVVRSVNGRHGDNLNDLALPLGKVAKAEGVEFNDMPEGPDVRRTILEKVGLRNPEENGLRSVVNDNL